MRKFIILLLVVLAVSIAVPANATALGQIKITHPTCDSVDVEIHNHSRKKAKAWIVEWVSADNWTKSETVALMPRQTSYLHFVYPEYSGFELKITRPNGTERVRFFNACALEGG